MKIYYLYIISFIIFSCANQTAPTGGPKDEDPPVLISSSPTDRQINFQKNTVELEFDEQLKLLFTYE